MILCNAVGPRFFSILAKKTSVDFNGARDYILHRLRTELNPSLFYHSVEHTIDVYEATRRLTEVENIEGKSKILLETAALYHDSGMLIQYENHEEISCDFVKKVLPGFGYTTSEVDEITSLIMLTTMPQKAVYLPDQILCDADLDYLGRDDFFIHSFQLQLEWQVNGIMSTNLAEWLEIQKSFLSRHNYYTKGAFAMRNEKKLRNLAEIEYILNPETCSLNHHK